MFKRRQKFFHLEDKEHIQRTAQMPGTCILSQLFNAFNYPRLTVTGTWIIFIQIKRLNTEGRVFVRIELQFSIVANLRSKLSQNVLRFTVCFDTT